MTLLGESLKRGAALYFKAGYTAIPLILDSNGLPKRPFSNDWQNTPHDADVIASLPWERAFGLGLVLGPASDNLAVLDIDDEELGAVSIEQCQNTRRIRTVRNRAHVYVREITPSPSSKFTVAYKGRDVTIELKATGTQVAAPPTPGYRHACPRDLPPLEVYSVAAAWQALALRLHLTSPGVQSSEYPKPWQENVGEGQRNNSLYVEAHRLREAGLPLNQALDIIRFRLQAYAPGLPWREAERTVKSAYSKGILAKREGVNELAGLLD